MEVLVVFVLAAMGCSLTEGILVPKCDLKEELMTAIGELPAEVKQRGLTVETLVAKIVCHVKFASGFDTSAVNQLTPGTGGHNTRRKRNLMFGLATLVDPSVTIQPRTRERRHARQAPSNTQPTPTTGPPQLDENVWTLYGLFQLSNHLVCSDGTTPSPNICGMDCNNLLDDNMHDDISCLLKLFSYLVEKGFGAPHWDELREMIKLIYQEECRDANATEFFAECL